MAQQNAPKYDRVTSDPQILAGKPIVRGTRIPVELVLAHLAENLDLGDLFAAYPRLGLEDVKACLAYAQNAVTRQYQAETLRAAAGALSDADYPEWSTPEKTSQWVHDLRRSADAHTSRQLSERATPSLAPHVDPSADTSPDA